MWSHSLARSIGILGALYLLAGCSQKVETFLYNNTDTELTVGPGSTGKKLTIAPHTVAYVNEFWTMNPTVTRRGKTYHFSEPMSSSPIPPDYKGGDGFKLRLQFEFADDNRIYVLPRGTTPSKTHPPQPIDFPLKPQ